MAFYLKNKTKYIFMYYVKNTLSRMFGLIRFGSLILLIRGSTYKFIIRDKNQPPLIISLN